MKGIDARAQINHTERLQCLLLSPESKQSDSAAHLTLPSTRRRRKHSPGHSSCEPRPPLGAREQGLCSHAVQIPSARTRAAAAAVRAEPRAAAPCAGTSLRLSFRTGRLEVQERRALPQRGRDANSAGTADGSAREEGHQLPRLCVKHL